MTFRLDFQKRGIAYEVRSASASDLYERLEPVINAGELELLDHPTLIEQLVSLIWRGTKITHEHGAHDDHATALALAVSVVRVAIARTQPKIVEPAVYSKQLGWLGTGAANTAGKSATALFFEHGGYSGGGSHWPGSNPAGRDW